MFRFSRLAPLLALPLLGGCDLVVMNTAGDVARQQADLILWSTVLMLLIIVPVMTLIVLFAWRYRAANEEAEYKPDWDHSTGLELVIWSAPLLIVIALGALTWVSTHLLDPYRPLGRLAPGRAVPAQQRPLEVQVVSLDWKWLFIYPEQGIATVNELVLPADRQVRFRLTSSSVMNTFYVPALAGMIYTMPGMETKLHAVFNKTGRFDGRSANYSGAGFSGMTFPTLSMDSTGFDRWVAAVKDDKRQLGTGNYLRLEKPSENVPAIRFGAVQPGLFDRVVQMCVQPGQPCMAATTAHDRQQPGSHPPVNDRAPQPGGSKGALEKTPEEKGSSPHNSAPSGPAGGRNAPNSPANRNMTRLMLPAPLRAGPGTVTTAQG
jgi:cytochrome o ubiquinol oxidase subunit 2